MRANNQIRRRCRDILGIEAEPVAYTNVWQEVSLLAAAFGSCALVRVFEEWAHENRDAVRARPVSEFLKVAVGRITGICQLAPDQKSQELVNDLVFASRGRVIFHAQQRRGISLLLKSWSAEEIFSVFTEFLRRADGNPTRLKFVAHDFCDMAPQVLLTRKRLNHITNGLPTSPPKTT